MTVPEITQKTKDARSGRTLTERIEAAWDEAIETRSVMLYASRNLEDLRAQAKLDHADEWAAAKNNDVRAVMLAGWLEEDDYYGRSVLEYQEGRMGFRLALLEIERLKLLVALDGRTR